MENNNKPLKGEAFNAGGVSVKKGLVAKQTTIGAYLYDPKLKETAETAEWFAFTAPNGNYCRVYGDE